MDSKTIIQNENYVDVEIKTEIGATGKKVLSIKVGGFNITPKSKQRILDHILTKIFEASSFKDEEEEILEDGI